MGFRLFFGSSESIRISPKWPPPASTLTRIHPFESTHARRPWKVSSVTLAMAILLCLAPRWASRPGRIRPDILRVDDGMKVGGDLRSMGEHESMRGMNVRNEEL
jgi:hypothetical protein